MVIYADTSFLFSLYASDGNSAKAHEECLEAPVAFTVFQRHELFNALHLAEFRKVITAEQSHAIQALIATDIQCETLAEIQVNWEEVYARAETLSSTYTPKTGCRALDILHVAIALSLNLDVFYTFDVRQQCLARKAGLTVRPT